MNAPLAAIIGLVVFLVIINAAGKYVQKNHPAPRRDSDRPFGWPE